MSIKFSWKMSTGFTGSCQGTFSFLTENPRISLVAFTASAASTSATLARSAQARRVPCSSTGSSSLYWGFSAASLALCCSRQITPDQWNLQDALTRYRFRTWEPYCRRKQKDGICILGHFGHASFLIIKTNVPLTSRILKALQMSNPSIRNRKYCFLN